MPDDSYRLLVARLARLQAAYSAGRSSFAPGTTSSARPPSRRWTCRRGGHRGRRGGGGGRLRRAVHRYEGHELWRRVRDRPAPSRAGSPTAHRSPRGMSIRPRTRHCRCTRRRSGWTARSGRRGRWPAGCTRASAPRAAGAGLGYAAAQGARWWALRAGGDPAAFAPVIQQVLFVVAPFVGLVPARILATGRARS